MMNNTLLLLSCILLNIVSCFSQKQEKLPFGAYEILKNKETKTYQIRTKKGTLKLDSLKYVTYAGTGLQVLDSKNKIRYLSNTLDTIAYPERRQDFYCGTVADFSVEIIENDTNYIIKKTEDNRVYNKGIETYIIDTIAKNNVKAICFLNKQQRIRYSENFYFPETLIIETEQGFGIRSNKKTTFYKNIEYSNPLFIKVEQQELWGYFNVTATKYAELGDFVFDLAHFVLKNGVTGYLDKKGNEYY